MATWFRNSRAKEDVVYVGPMALKSDITLGISDSLGFGGHNACVAFRRYEA